MLSVVMVKYCIASISIHFRRYCFGEVAMFFTFREVMNLPRHLMSKAHKWSKEKASTARLTFGLNKERAILSPSKRKQKPRLFEKRTCPMSHCLKVVKRVYSHLRQFHNLSTKDSLKCAARAEIVLDDKINDVASDSSEFSSSEDSEKEEKKTIDSHYMVAVHRPEIDDMCEDDGEDRDWIVERYLENLEDDGKDEQVDEICKKVRQDESYSDSNTMSDDENIDYEDVEKKFYMTSKQEDDFLKEFSHWLTTPDGGGKPVKTANKHSSTVMNIIHSTENDEAKYQNLHKRNFMNEWMSKMHEEGKKPGTIKTYLGSVLHFYNYIEIKGIENFDSEQVKSMEKIIKQWRRNLWKKIRKRKFEKQLSDLARIPSPKDIAALDKSAVVIEARACLDEHKMNGNLPLTRKSYCLTRDFIMTYIILDNASRPGALANMTLKELHSAIRQGNSHLIRVLKHKNEHMGPANLSLTMTLYRSIHFFIKYVRSKLPEIGNDENDVVFLSYTGSGMDSSLVTTQFSSFYNRALGKEIRMNPTLVRKFTTTAVHEMENERLKQDTADLLCHSKRMADEEYTLVDRQKKASATSASIRDIQRMAGDDYDDIMFEVFQSDIDDGQITTEKVREKINTDERLKSLKGSTVEEKKMLDSIRYEIKKKEKANKDDIRFKNRASRHNMESEKFVSELPPKRKRTAFTKEDNDLVHDHLANFIKSDIQIKRDEFEKYVSNIPELADLLQRVGIMSIITKIRTERKTR